MARGSTPIKPPEPKVQPSVITASAMNMQNVSDSPGAYRAQSNWQADAWAHYHDVGALYYAATVTGSVMSRAVLSCIKKQTGDKGTSPGTAAGTAAMKAFFGGPQGQMEFLRKVGVHMTVAGEFWTVARKAGKSEYEWYVLSTNEIRAALTSDAVWEMKGEGNDWVPLRRGVDVAYRTWESDPSDRMQATSAVRSQLRLLDRIRLLTQSIESQLKSRLTANGLLLVPSQISPPTPPPGLAIPANAGTADIMMLTLAAMMQQNIANPGSAAAQVPIALQGDGQYLDKVRLIQFWSEMDASITEMLAGAYQEFAVGMNMPLETILGQGDSSHWNAWANDESYIKAHVEPMLGLIAGGITKGYLRPITGVGPDDMVQVDTTQLRVRPDRSKEAVALFDRKLLGSEATLRENGYGEEDRMSRDEVALWTARGIASGQTTPDQVAAVARSLGVKAIPDSPDSGQQEARPTPAPSRSNRRGAPEPDQSEADGPNPFKVLLAAAEPVVYRALERAGNKLYTGYVKTDAMKDIRPDKRYMAAPDTMHWDANRLDLLLEGAWDCVPELLGEYGDPAVITAALDSYTRSLLSERTPHKRELLDVALSVHVHGMKELIFRV